MKLLRRIYLTICCLGLAAVAVAWPRTYRRADAFIINRDRGRALGIATNPGEIFFSSNQDKQHNPASLVFRERVKHFRYPPSGPADLYRYTILTHYALLGDMGGSSRTLRTPRRFPTFTTRWTAPGIRAQGGTFNGVDYEQIVLSFWLITCVLAISPAITGWRRVTHLARRRHRRRHGQCLHCGYDLRASQDRCPECNHPIPTPDNPPPTPPPAEADSPR